MDLTDERRLEKPTSAADSSLVSLKLSSVPFLALVLISIVAALGDHDEIAIPAILVAGVGKVVLERRERRENPFKYDRKYGGPG